MLPNTFATQVALENVCSWFSRAVFHATSTGYQNVYNRNEFVLEALPSTPTFVLFCILQLVKNVSDDGRKASTLSFLQKLLHKGSRLPTLYQANKDFERLPEILLETKRKVIGDNFLKISV